MAADIGSHPPSAWSFKYKFDVTITMVLDECTHFPRSYEVAEASMEMSMRWAGLSKQAYRSSAKATVCSVSFKAAPIADLRLRSATR